ncbi:TetR/AcrR family transcriptional regulator [Streptomyces fagopyri]|uniref:TetR/AcrR family transcriptional regulator n=1 Tax=Streptomyces fagopyri TaxID=2662397 RepID=UPI0033F032A1
MSERTVDWTALRPQGEERGDEGLREKKKRLMRQQLSDTATGMFMERGFDGVRVSEIAAACGVSEKTVFNYFPTKESLVLDRWEATTAALRSALAEPATPPVEAVLDVLSGELGAMTSWLAGQEDPAHGAALMARFGALIGSTPSLRAHQHDQTGRLVSVAAEALAEWAATGPDDPEPRIAAIALLGLWDVQSLSLRRNLREMSTPERLHAAVTADVGRAAELLRTGLASFGREAREAPGSGGTRRS